ncbi:MAG: NADH dehydrogenase (quinone) subunit D [Anaerolineales bacterium]|nr:NADH dehydrogenase (quinone) subunit D [Anaerolineales bacterium]MCW5855134.1 NADH dehydrogenase (quinone) subunit D [Anaerolineales bacterium]
MSSLEQIEITTEELRHLVSPRAIEGDTILLNMGPQHPSTHGVLRLLLELDGEIVVNCIPDIGYLHTGIEKSIESKSYEKSEVMTDRLDYLNTMGNNLAYCLAVEKLVDLDVPERAQAVRVIFAELQRIASHMVWLGTHMLDLGAMSVFFYTFTQRERILDLMEMAGGQRMMTTYFRPGGLWRDVPDGWVEGVRELIDDLPRHFKEFEALISKNPIFLDRTKDIGILSAEDGLAWGVTGSTLRGSGVDYDIRKAEPYSGYERYEFDVPLATEGDVYARYWVRMKELYESVRIVHQALDKLPSGPFRSNNRKFVPPPRAELGESMEAVIHHFKLWTEGFPAPKNSVYLPVESPRGELGVLLEGDGGPKPYRCYWRTPSFVNLQVLPMLSKGHYVADLVAIIGSIDIVLGDTDR